MRVCVLIHPNAPQIDERHTSSKGICYFARAPSSLLVIGKLLISGRHALLGEDLLLQLGIQHH